MARTIVFPASCERRAVIRCLYSKGSSPSEIHRELWLVHGLTVISEGKVTKWCQDHKFAWWRPSIQTDKIVKNVKTKNCEEIGNRQLLLWLMNFRKLDVPLYSIYTIVTEKFEYQKFCATWLTKMLTKQQRIYTGLAFLNRYRPDNLVCYGRRNVDILHAESKKQPMQWHHSSSMRPKT